MTHIKYPHADHLINEEIDYELKLRGKVDDLKLEREAKNRLVRYLMLEDIKEGNTYDQLYTIDQEYDNACAKIKYLAGKLEKEWDHQHLSRLSHYFYRIERTRPSEPMGEKMRRDLLDTISGLIQKFSIFKGTKGQQHEEQEESEGESKEDEISKSGSDQNLSREVDQDIDGAQALINDEEKLGAKKKSPREKETSTELELRKRIDQLEKQLLRACLAWSGVDTQLISATNSTTIQTGKDQAAGGELGTTPPSHLLGLGISKEGTKGASADDWLKEHKRKQKEHRESLWDDRRQTDNLSDYEQNLDDREGSVFSKYSDIDYNWDNGLSRRKQNQFSQRKSLRFESTDTNEDKIQDHREQRSLPQGVSGGRNRQDRQQTRRQSLSPEYGENNSARVQPRGSRRSAPIENTGEGNSRNRDRDTTRGLCQGCRCGYDGERRTDGRDSLPRRSGTENRYDRRDWSPERGRNGDRFEHNRRYYGNGDFEIKNADRRMEKWHLTFNGESSRQKTLEDFLHKIRRLARMDKISDEILLQRIHTILRGDAYNWYLCYADDFRDWEDFEMRIRYMYGNPNKDQGNRKKIYERYQERNETFLAFKMEIERLNKLLTDPLDEQRLFEIIFDNMRPHYRSKLACRRVVDLRNLEYYAYKIDSQDPVLKAVREGPTKSTSWNKESGKNSKDGGFKISKPVHAVDIEEESDDSYSEESEQEELNIIEKKSEKSQRTKDQVKYQVKPKQPSTPQEATETRVEILCWNCRKSGHIWRNCPDDKKRFCYTCGAQGKTSKTCTHNGQVASKNSEN